MFLYIVEQNMNFCCSVVTQAIINNDIDKFKELLNKRKRIDIQDNLGYSSLHVAVMPDHTINPIMVELLLNHSDVEINARSFEGHTSLYVACNTKNANLDVIKNILDHGADPNIGDLEKITPLHLACKYGNIDLVELLLKFNSDINCQDFNLETPLHYAIEFNFKSITLCLLKANADTSIKNGTGMTPLISALKRKCNFAEILVPYTTNLDEVFDSSYPLIILALHTNNINLIRVLIENGVDLYLSKQSPTVLFTAVNYCSYDIFKLLWDNINPEIFLKNENFMPKLFRECIRKRDFRYIQPLLNAGELEWKIHGKRGLFVNMFKQRLLLYRSESHFEENKQIYFAFTRVLVKQKISLSSADIESFILYFRTCPYKLDLLKILLDGIKPDITEYLVIYATKFDMKMAAFLLACCIHFYPENVFEYFFKNISGIHDVTKILKFFLARFSPTFNYKRQLQYALSLNEKINDKYLSILLNNNVKSLAELSRDVIRSQMQDICEESFEFLEKVEVLNVPETVKDIIKCKLPVNRIT